MQPPKVLLSDIGNVLLRFEYGVCERIYGEFFRLPPDTVQEVIHESEAFFALERGTMPWSAFRYCCIERLAALGDPRGAAAPEERERAEELFDRHWCSPFRDPVEGVCDLWQALRKRLVIASASNVDAVRFGAGVRPFGRLAGLFDHETHSYMLGARKGDADYFPRLLRTVGASPEECLFVDDLEAHVAAAARMGIRAIRLRDTSASGVAALRVDLAAAGVPVEWFAAAEK